MLSIRPSWFRILTLTSLSVFGWCAVVNAQADRKESSVDLAESKSNDANENEESVQDKETKKTDGQPEVAPDLITPSSHGIRLAKPVKYKWRVGVKIVTGKKACRDLLVTIPVPNEWPEQQVTIAEETIPSSIPDLTYRDLDSGVKQLVAKIRTIPPKTIIEMDVTFAVSVNEILPPTDTAVFSIPEKVSRDIKQYLTVSPGITYRNSKLRKQVKDIVKDQQTDWAKVEAIYDWIRNNIDHRDGEPEDSLKAFRAKAGCSEDLVGLFVAMCRANKVPARMVWVEGHQLAEFYLVDQDETGHWFPCNPAGLRDFGSNSDPRIILQKGDNIKVPEKEQRQKYVAEFVTGSGASKPAVGFIRDLLPD